MALYVTKGHVDVSLEDYYRQFIGETTGVCSVCGSGTKFNGLTIGFSLTCSSICGSKSVPSREKRREKQAQTNLNISLANTGRKFSDEHRLKLKAARASVRKDISGPMHWNWNPDRLEQARKNKLSKLVYGLVGRALEHADKEKDGKHGFELLGYTPKELREHLERLFEPGMTWENHGLGDDRWHVDHIKPICEFGSSATVSEINALSNLRPLWQPENLSRGGKLGNKRRYRHG